MERQSAIGTNCSVVITIVSALVACMGCHSPHVPTLHLVFMPDLSKSIEPSARRACAETIMNASAELARGDSLVVIPITDNAAEQAPAKVGRYRFGVKRSAFDDDLPQILSSERHQLERMCAGAASPRSDIFSSLSLAEEELAHSPGPDSLRAIAILSDFIEDDGEHCFTRGKNLASPTAATKFAAQLAADASKLNGVQIYLGRIPSVSFRTLSQSRREAIKAFWMEYLRRRGAQVEWATDGIGGLTPFVARLATARPQQETAAAVLGIDQ